jgi:hypothetical protein
MRKEVLCPVCHSRIIDSEDCICTQLRIVNPQVHDPPKDSWKPDYYLKCWKCRSIVALRKV